MLFGVFTLPMRDFYRITADSRFFDPGPPVRSGIYAVIAVAKKFCDIAAIARTIAATATPRAGGAPGRPQAIGSVHGCLIMKSFYWHCCIFFVFSRTTLASGGEFFSASQLLTKGEGRTGTDHI